MKQRQGDVNIYWLILLTLLFWLSPLLCQFCKVGLARQWNEHLSQSQWTEFSPLVQLDFKGFSEICVAAGQQLSSVFYLRRSTTQVYGLTIVVLLWFIQSKADQGVWSSLRPNIIPHGINGGRKWWNILTEDCSTTNSFSSVIIGLFYFDDWLSDYSTFKWNILTPQVEFCTFHTCA